MSIFPSVNLPLPLNLSHHLALPLLMHSSAFAIYCQLSFAQVLRIPTCWECTPHHTIVCRRVTVIEHVLIFKSPRYQGWFQNPRSNSCLHAVCTSSVVDLALVASFPLWHFASFTLFCHFWHALHLSDMTSTSIVTL